MAAPENLRKVIAKGGSVSQTNRVGIPKRSEARAGTRIPLWRRITAFFSLAFLSVTAGAAIALVLGTTALIFLFLVERAISG